MNQAKFIKDIEDRGIVGKLYQLSIPLWQKKWLIFTKRIDYIVVVPAIGHSASTFVFLSNKDGTKIDENPVHIEEDALSYIFTLNVMGYTIEGLQS